MQKKKLGHFLLEINTTCKELYALDVVIDKLNKIGYNYDPEDYEEYLDNDYFFIQIDKDEKDIFAFDSIVGPAALASQQRMPIPIDWFEHMFDEIMSDDASVEELDMLQQIAYKAHK